MGRIEIEGKQWDNLLIHLTNIYNAYYMQCLILSTSHVVTHLMLIITLLLDQLIRKARHKEVKELVQGHTAK